MSIGPRANFTQLYDIYKIAGSNENTNTIERSQSCCYRPISQTVFMLSIAINRAEHVCATVIIKHNYMLMCNHKIVINIMLCLLNSTGHI